MLQEDYIFRPLFQLINEIISKFSSVKIAEIKDLDQYLDDLYIKYLNNKRSFFIENEIKYLIENESISNEELNLLAELFYRETLLHTDNSLKLTLLNKANTILKYISNNSNTYSLDIANRITLINDKIENLI